MCLCVCVCTNVFAFWEHLGCESAQQAGVMTELFQTLMWLVTMHFSSLSVHHFIELLA